MQQSGSFGHGKVILFGEHSVVYGKPAIAAALQRGAEATATSAAAWQLDIEPWHVCVTPDAASPQALARAFAALVAEAPHPVPLHVQVRISLPGGAGLGSSAALGVAVLAAMDRASGRQREPAALAEASLAWERVFHGNPSGVDSAAAACGGVLWFERGRAWQPLRLRRPMHLVVAASGEVASTQTMVDAVASGLRRDEARASKTLEAMASVAVNGRAALQDGDAQHLGQLMDLNHMLLSGLLVSTPKLEELCNAARQAGATGAKLTGAGGGGCMVAAAADEKAAEAICEALRRLSQDAFVTTLREGKEA